MNEYQITAFSDVMGNTTFELWDMAKGLKVDTATFHVNHYLTSPAMVSAACNRFSRLVPEDSIRCALAEAQMRAFMQTTKYVPATTTWKPLTDNPLLIEAQQDCECPVCHAAFTRVSVGKKHLKDKHGIAEDVAEEWAKSRLSEQPSEPKSEPKAEESTPYEWTFPEKSVVSRYLMEELTSVQKTEKMLRTVLASGWK